MRRYQDGKLEIREDVKRPYYFVRITVRRMTDAGERICRERRVLGFVDEISKKQAMEVRAATLGAVNSGRVMIQAQISMNLLLNHFKEARLPQIGAATAARYLSHIEYHIRPSFGDKKLCDVDKQSIEAWLASKEKAGLGWWSRQGLKAMMAALFSAAKEWRMWDADNPADGVRIGRKKEKREKRLVTADQIRLILSGVCDRTRLMILTAMLLGLRVSEICGLKWEDFDFQNGVLYIRRSWSCRTESVGDTKTEAGERKLELGPLAGEFALIRKAMGWVFSDDGKTPVDERDILRHELRPLLRRLGFYYPGMGWHAYRRSNVTMRQTEGGATPLEAMKAAGHARLDVTLLYTLGSAERERAQVQAIFDKIMGPTEGPKQ